MKTCCGCWFFRVKSRQAQLNGRCFLLVVISGCVGGALNLLNFHGMLQGLSCWIVWWCVGLEFVCYISSFWSIMNPSNDNMPLHCSRHCKNIPIQRKTSLLNFASRMILKQGVLMQTASPPKFYIIWVTLLIIKQNIFYFYVKGMVYGVQ